MIFKYKKKCLLKYFSDNNLNLQECLHYCIEKLEKDKNNHRQFNIKDKIKYSYLPVILIGSYFLSFSILNLIIHENTLTSYADTKIPICISNIETKYYSEYDLGKYRKRLQLEADIIQNNKKERLNLYQESNIYKREVDIIINNTHGAMKKFWMNIKNGKEETKYSEDGVC